MHSWYCMTTFPTQPITHDVVRAICKVFNWELNLTTCVLHRIQILPHKASFLRTCRMSVESDNRICMGILKNAFVEIAAFAI